MTQPDPTVTPIATTAWGPTKVRFPIVVRARAYGAAPALTAHATVE